MVLIALTGVLSNPEMPLRSPKVHSSRRSAEKGLLGVLERGVFAFKEEIQSVDVHISQTKAEMYTRVKPGSESSHRRTSDG